MKGKDDLALVQTRWGFVNKDENLLTRLQHINLAFHFEVEQQVNGWFINFFGFNGTAGVWRIKALEDCGGWLDRTTVEDMDIAVRAHLCGWKFIYLNDVQVYFAFTIKTHTCYCTISTSNCACSYLCSASANFLSRMKHTRNNSIAGIQDPCNYSVCVSGM